VQTGGAAASAEGEPHSSFCDRGAVEGRPVLVAPGASICRECVEAAEAVLRETVPAR